MNKLLWRALNMVRHGRVTVVDDSGSVQQLQVDQGPLDPGSARSLLDKVSALGLFGFASNPPLKSDVVLARLGGTRSLSIVIATNDQASRLKNLAPGDSAIYDQRGAYVWLTPDGLVIDGGGMPATIRNVGVLTVDGDVHVTGDVITRSAGTAVSVNAVHDAYNSHKHTGVATGSGVSGTTNDPV